MMSADHDQIAGTAPNRRDPNGRDPAGSSAAAVPIADRIRDRAYQLWEEHARPDGRDVEFWQRAESEILARAAADRPEPDRPDETRAAPSPHPAPPAPGPDLPEPGPPAPEPDLPEPDPPAPGPDLPEPGYPQPGPDLPDPGRPTPPAPPAILAVEPIAMPSAEAAKPGAARSGTAEPSPAEPAPGSADASSGAESEPPAPEPPAPAVEAGAGRAVTKQLQWPARAATARVGPAPFSSSAVAKVLSSAGTGLAASAMTPMQSGGPIGMPHTPTGMAQLGLLMGGAVGTVWLGWLSLATQSVERTVRGAVEMMAARRPEDVVQAQARMLKSSFDDLMAGAIPLIEIPLRSARILNAAAIEALVPAVSRRRADPPRRVSSRTG